MEKKISKRKPTTIEIDVSGQLTADGDTVFAYSNGENYSILVKKSVKKEAKKLYLLTKKTPGRFYFDFYVGGLVSLFLRLNSLGRPVYLDWELSGRHGEVRGELLFRLKKQKIKINSEIYAKKVGKKSPAHLLAHSVYKKRKKANKVLILEELLAVLK